MVSSFPLLEFFFKNPHQDKKRFQGGHTKCTEYQSKLPQAPKLLKTKNNQIKDELNLHPVENLRHKPNPFMNRET